PVTRQALIPPSSAFSSTSPLIFSAKSLAAINGVRPRAGAISTDTTAAISLDPSFGTPHRPIVSALSDRRFHSGGGVSFTPKSANSSGTELTTGLLAGGSVVGAC